MNTPHHPSRKPRTRPRNRGGAPRGNQNARKHGRYSKLRPADRPAFMRKTLRSYGIEGTASLLGVRYADLAAQSTTHLQLVLALRRTAAQLAETQAQLRPLRECRHA